MRDLNKLFEAYLSCRRIEDRDELGWGMWAGEGQPAGEAYFVDTDVYLRKTLAVRLLQVAASKPEASLGAHTFPLEGEDISSLIDTSDNSLRRTYNDIQENPGKWAALIGEEVRGKIPLLLATFDRTMAAKEARDRIKIAASPLSQAKVDEFIQTLKEGFADQAVFSALAAKHGFIREDLNPRPPAGSPKAWGFNQVSQKDLFVEHTNIFHDHGQEYGRGMARGEDRYAILALAGVLDQFGEQVKNMDEVSAALLAAGAQLRKSGKTTDAIITSLDLEDTTAFRQAENFTPSWAMKSKAPDEPGFIGQFKMSDGAEIPVYRLFYDNPKHIAHTICLVNLKAVGEMVRLFPGFAPEDVAHLHGFTYCTIVDLNANDEERNRLLAANPKWLRTELDKEQHLRMRVLLKIYQRTDFRFKKGSGLRISVVAE